MATSEPLVPKGLPKGERQNVRAGMQRAGVPLAPRQGGTPGLGSSSQTPPPPGSTPGGFDPVQLVAGNAPGDFPFLTESATSTEDAPVDASPGPIEALAASAQSSFAQAVLTRLQARRDR